MRDVQHKRVEFEALTSAPPDKLAIASFGDAGVGKTHFICTLPDPIGVIALDRKTRPRLLAVNRQYRKQLLFPKQDFIRHDQPLKVSQMSLEDSMKYYGDHLSRTLDAIYTLAENRDVQSIAIDSATQLWEDILFKHFGRAFRIMPRDRGPANADMRDVLNSCSHKHLVMTHQSSEIWKNDKPTGRFTLSGWSKIDYYANVIIEQTYNEREEQFALTVRLAQDRPDLIGQTLLYDADISFDMLSALLYTDGQ